MPSNPLPQPRLPWPGIAKQSTPSVWHAITARPGGGYLLSSLLGAPPPVPASAGDTAPLSATSCPRCADLVQWSAIASDALSNALSLIGRMARSYDFSPDEIDAVETEIRAALERVAAER